MKTAILQYILCVLFVEPSGEDFKIGFKPVQTYKTMTECQAKLTKAAASLTMGAAGVACLPVQAPGKST